MEENQWPPLSYLKQLEEYEKLCPPSKEKGGAGGEKGEKEGETVGSDEKCAIM